MFSLTLYYYYPEVVLYMGESITANGRADVAGPGDNNDLVSTSSQNTLPKHVDIKIMMSNILKGNLYFVSVH